MSNSGYPDNNPKTVLGVQKTPLHLVPPSAKYHLAAAFADGATKYGPYNWRDNNVSASIYIAASQRHIDDWWDGEDLSRDAKVHHLAHAMACMAILLDAMSIGMLNDDRPTEGAATNLHEEYADNKKKESNGETPTTSESELTSEYVWSEFNRAYDAVEHSRVLDLQANLLPADLTGYWFRGFDGQFEYWQSPDGGMGRYHPTSPSRVPEPTVSGLFPSGGGTFNPLYDLVNGHSSGEISVATGYGDSRSSWFDVAPELRIHDDRRTSETLYVGDGCLDARVGCGGKPTT